MAPADRRGVGVTAVQHSRVRKVSPSGVVSTVAGNGSYGYSGDGGPSGAAALDEPTGLAVDAAGDLYIADTDNNRIRKVDTLGTISTVMGTGVAGSASNQLNHPRGVAGNATAVYVADTGNNRVQGLFAWNGVSRTVVGETPGPVHLSKPSGITLDVAGNAYIADTGDNRIVALSSEGKARAMAGNAVAGFTGDGGQALAAELDAPPAIAVDAASNLSIVDTGNNRIRGMAGLPLITDVAGTGADGNSGDGGPAVQATMVEPYGVVKDQAGNVYVSDSAGHDIRRISPAGVISTFVHYTDQVIPSGLAIDGHGDLYFADPASATVRKVDPRGNTTVVAGTPGQTGSSGDGGPATQALLSTRAPSIAFDTAGDLYVADNDNHKIRKVDTSGIITTFAGTGVAGYSGDGGPATSAQLNSYYGSSVAVDGAGNVYFSDTANFRVRKIDANGTITTVAGTGAQFNQTKTPFAYHDGAVATAVDLYSPVGIAVDAAGTVYFTDLNTVDRIGADGVIHVIAGTGYYAGENGNLCSGNGGAAKLAEFFEPDQITLDTGGNVYLADDGCRQVRKIAAA